jgi:ribosomal-protein-alanine N-acetyltransferase
MIFKTQRLFVRDLEEGDQDAFFDMMSNPNVMDPIPRPVMDRQTSDANFLKHFNRSKDSQVIVWAICVQEKNELIGIAALLKNNKNEDEIGYRLRERYWGVGYGTEIAKGLIDYAFEELKTPLVAADVNTRNHRSVKILEKFFEIEFEFFNEIDNCTDRRYKLMRENWMRTQN